MWLSQVMEYETGVKPRFAMTTPRRKKIRSVCAPYQPHCGQCTYMAQVDQQVCSVVTFDNNSPMDWGILMIVGDEINQITIN